MEPLRWSSLEYEEKARTSDWFWGLALITLGIAGVSAYFENYLFSVLILIGAFSLSLFAIRKPREIIYQIEQDGIYINDTLYPFNTLNSFCINSNRDRSKIIIVSKKFFVPHIIIPIEEYNPEDVREFLISKISEVEHNEPLIHVIAERFGL